MKPFKLSWGTGIFITLALFVGAMACVFYISSRQDRSLVRKDYYADNMRHQENIDHRHNYDALLFPLAIVVGDTAINVVFPPSLVGKAIEGTLVFYRPSDHKLDRIQELNGLTKVNYTFLRSQFTKGKYIVKLRFIVEDKGYLTEKELIIP
jgi:hypothetical protein